MVKLLNLSSNTKDLQIQLNDNLQVKYSQHYIERKFDNPVDRLVALTWRANIIEIIGDIILIDNGSENIFFYLKDLEICDDATHSNS